MIEAAQCMNSKCKYSGALMNDFILFYIYNSYNVCGFFMYIFFYIFTFSIFTGFFSICL